MSSTILSLKTKLAATWDFIMKYKSAVLFVPFVLVIGYVAYIAISWVISIVFGIILIIGVFLAIVKKYPAFGDWIEKRWPWLSIQIKEITKQ